MFIGGYTILCLVLPSAGETKLKPEEGGGKAVGGLHLWGGGQIRNTQDERATRHPQHKEKNGQRCGARKS